MNRILSILIACGMASTFQAQTIDFVVFSDDGAKFTLVVDGDVKNEAPTSRVVATGIRTETPVIMVRFEDASIPPIKQNTYLDRGKEYTMMLTTNKKGARVLRMRGEAPLGTAASSEPSKPAKPASFEDSPASTTVVQELAPVDEVITTTTVVEEGDVDMEGENVNITMGVNGVDFNMSVKAGTQSTPNSTRSTTTTTTTTTTTRSNISTTAKPVVDTKPVESEAYVMPGYSGRVGCPWPMSATEFSDVRESIESKSFEDSKMTLAKQVGSNRCFTVDQVKGMMGLFSFEDSKLDFAKFAFERTHDIDNYYKVNDAFGFESTMDDLNEFIQAR